MLHNLFVFFVLFCFRGVLMLSLHNIFLNILIIILVLRAASK